MKPKLISIFLILFVFISSCFSQVIDMDSLLAKKIYTSIEQALKNPQQVYRLHLKNKKLTKVPDEIYLFPNLNELVLSKNKITAILARIEELENLQILDLSQNKLYTLPDEIGHLTNLRKLILNRNDITFFPAGIGQLFKLEFIDLWSNLIVEFPPEIAKLAPTLKEIDMRVIYMTDLQQFNIKEFLPKTKIQFSHSCNCGN